MIEMQHAGSGSDGDARDGFARLPRFYLRPVRIDATTNSGPDPLHQPFHAADED
ncbi:hypothetical protein [Aromatoleum tolulyticum]|uniref:hypothetical protein n=1 Tax=Aromatoleum tolulyticum TaxID=34027 RepID=UPI0014830ABE|nr:hypothetical protein [Aromatoleum tolulyticum]